MSNQRSFLVGKNKKIKLNFHFSLRIFIPDFSLAGFFSPDFYSEFFLPDFYSGYFSRRIFLSPDF